MSFVDTTLKVPGCTVCKNEFHSALKDFLECLQIIRPSFKKEKKEKKNSEKNKSTSNGKQISNKEKLTKNAFSGQPKGLKSTHNNTTEDFKCVMCVFSTDHSVPFTKGHTACRTKSEISLKVQLWSPERVFGKEMNASPQNCLMGLKERQHSSPTIT